MKNEHELKVVSIRMVDEPPLLSDRRIRSAHDAVEVMAKELQKYDRELFCILNLQTNGKVINMNVVSMGTLNTAVVSPREVFKTAILSNAASILLVHNHPSGECSPSKEDMQVTERLIECGKLIDIPVVDHVITGREGAYYSFREHGQIFNPADYNKVAENGIFLRKDESRKR